MYIFLVVILQTITKKTNMYIFLFVCVLVGQAAAMNLQSRLIKKPIFHQKRTFAIEISQRDKLLEQATPHLWRLCSACCLKKVIKSALRVGRDQKFTHLHFWGNNGYGFMGKNGYGLTGKDCKTRWGKEFYNGSFSIKDQLRVFQSMHYVAFRPDHALKDKDAPLKQEALQIAKITAKDPTVFLSADKQFAAVSSIEYRTGHHDMPMASISCDVIDLKNKNIYYSPSRGRHHFHSAQFSPSNAYAFCTFKEAFFDKVRQAGFLSLAQKGKFTFNFGNAYFLNKEIEILNDYRGSNYACIDEIASATISPHGQHILTHIMSGHDEQAQENIILWTIEHMTQKLTEKQLSFIAQLPMSDHLYDHKPIEQQTANALRVIFPKNTHIPVNKTLLKDHDKAVFVSLPKEFQSKIIALYNIAVSS